MIQEIKIKTQILQIPKSVPKTLVDDKIGKGTNSINTKQREFTNVVQTYTNNVKYHWHIELVHIFISSSEGTVKSKLMKVKFNAI